VKGKKRRRKMEHRGTYANVIHKHLVKSHRSKGALDNVGNGHGGSHCWKERKKKKEEKEEKEEKE